ncbi:protein NONRESPONDING TO OXYLIPINS 2, mitochondrial-like isoform X1 [Arachis stenosperma]|uniref:protein NONRESPONDING TO OXYLIPINS 2, mitochondrial-like isoform X1 n=2 Tax=Arachis stenosperma TaxID=217475 RepID=UPI0025AB69A9|nr:protein NONRESPONDING TO OXYLIPINS 2, mitochondrial-like isoform X1 [Arachis stenosperma]XP_057735428.1 protein NONRESPONDING TO OXYLIPINS 2, mitochondrial-like isoform X1 [Arachis stenosperma]
MAWRSGSLSRSLISTARASLRPSAPRLRPPPLAAPRLHSRRFSIPASRNLGELGCMQSLLPVHSTMAVACLTSHLAVSARAYCELSHGTFRRSCQDR